MLGVLLWGAMLYNTHAQLAQARNGTTYQASRDTPSVLLVGDVALPLSARIEALALGRDESTLLVALGSGVLLTLADVPDSISSLSLAAPQTLGSFGSASDALRPLPRDGPASYARFVGLSDARYNSAAVGWVWAAVDRGRLRVFADGEVQTVLPDVTNAVSVAVAGWHMAVVCAGGSLTLVGSTRVVVRLSGVVDAELVLNSDGAPVVYYLADGMLWRNTAEPITRATGATALRRTGDELLAISGGAQVKFHGLCSSLDRLRVGYRLAHECA